MPNYIIRDRSGRQIDRIESDSPRNAIKLYKLKGTQLGGKGPNIPASTAQNEPNIFQRAWDFANQSFLPEHEFTGGYEPIDKLRNFLYKNVVQPTATPLGMATIPAWSVKSLPVAARAFMAGARAPANVITRAPGTKANWLKRLVDETKSMTLTSGLPGTNVSMHGVSMAATRAMSKPSSILDTARVLLSQPYAKQAADALSNENVQMLGRLVTKQGPRNPLTGRFTRVPITLQEFAKKRGVELSVSGQAGAPTLEPLLTGGKYNPARVLRNIQEKMFDEPLFGDAVRYFKLKQFKEQQAFLERTMRPTSNRDWVAKVGRPAAESANFFYGGLGKMSGWNKEALKPLFLAPDWYERHFKLAGKLAESIILNPTSPQGKTYRTFAASMLSTLGAIDAANFALSGKHVWNNEGGKFFQIDTGRLDETGRRIYLDPTSGAIDMAKVPAQVLHGMIKEKNMGAVLEPVMNRLSTVARTALDMAGQGPYKPSAFRLPQIKKEKVKGGGVQLITRPPIGEQFLNVGEDIGDMLLPGWMRSIENILHQGKRDPSTSTSQFISGSLEFPVRYAKDKPPEFKTRAEAKQEAIDAAKRRKAKQREERMKRRGGN